MEFFSRWESVFRRGESLFFSLIHILPDYSCYQKNSNRYYYPPRKRRPSPPFSAFFFLFPVYFHSFTPHLPGRISW